MPRIAASTRSSLIPRSTICCWIIRSSGDDSVSWFTSILYANLNARAGGRYRTALLHPPSRLVSSVPMPRTVRSHARPIITLTTDFGTRDYYVSAMKAVLIRECPQARAIDVTHEVPRHDILCGSITLERAVDGFLPGTVHLAVVDPGVGTDRRILVTDLNGQTIVCPDNGLITWPWHRLGPGDAYELTWPPAVSSHT